MNNFAAGIFFTLQFATPSYDEKLRA